MAMALEGIKIIDLSRLLPGPFCTMMLADMGADVLRIEDKRYAAEGPGRPTVMRNKRHMNLNLATEGGKEVFFKLAKNADVILEGFRPGVVKRLGISYEDVKEVNPGIIYCSISGYGQDGPYCMMAGHDVNYLSFGGLLGLCGESEDRPPVIPPVQIADIAAGGMMAAIAILTAVIHRNRTGEGQYIDISMTDGIVSMLVVPFSLFFMDSVKLKRGKLPLSGGYPCYNVYKTKDGKYISLGAVELRFWKNICEKLGRPEYVEHQYDDSKKREIFQWLQGVFITKTRDEWMEFFKNEDVCFGKVLSFEELWADPNVVQRGMLTHVEHHVKGKIPLIANPIKMSRTPPVIRRPPADFGEHTEEVLKELGYSDDDIESLRGEGAI